MNDGKKNKSIEDMIYDETKKRLQLMQDKKYQFPESISKMDVGLIVGGMAVSLGLIILCMMGVIV